MTGVISRKELTYRACAELISAQSSDVNIECSFNFDRNQEYMYMYSLRVRVGVCCDRDQRVRDGPKAKVSNVRTTRESY